jgi:serine/threonine-protein phosphatase 2A activator
LIVLLLLLLQLLPAELSDAAVELLPYWIDSFGNPTRIDYGTGHETTFVAFLYCLAALGLVVEGDQQGLVCVVFNRCDAVRCLTVSTAQLGFAK